MTVSYPEFVAATRREGEGLLTAARIGLDAPVPTCGEWTVGDLLSHVSRIYRFVATAVHDRATAAPARPEIPDGADLIDYAESALDDLVEALGGVDPQTPVWNWSHQEQVAGFWARRMAQESLVHRWDAQNAHGIAQRIEPELAADGLDELFDVLMPRILERDFPDRSTIPSVSLGLHASDIDRQWRVALSPAGFDPQAPGPAEVDLTGSAPRLLLTVYGRIGLDAIELTGSAAALDTWRGALHF
ncbi:MAG TPA: maleylpyruvate isomerase family mycothiol-dependent enzyme [Mycobacteriales bacterium]|nr:maleylpyruvate isomerase family mycothiol-dependent enzyme [Mycobacteriales bacterium]